MMAEHGSDPSPWPSWFRRFSNVAQGLCWALAHNSAARRVAAQNVHVTRAVHISPSHFTTSSFRFSSLMCA